MAFKWLAVERYELFMELDRGTQLLNSITYDRQLSGVAQNLWAQAHDAGTTTVPCTPSFPQVLKA